MSRLPHFEHGLYDRDTRLSDVNPAVVSSLCRILRPHELWKDWAAVLKDTDGEYCYLMQDIWLLELEKDPVSMIWHRLTTDGRNLGFVSDTLLQAKLIRAAEFIVTNVFNEESLVGDEVSTAGYATAGSGRLKTLQDDLRHFYVRSYRHLTPVPWNQHFVVELDKIFTEVMVIQVPKGQRGTMQLPHQISKEKATSREEATKEVTISEMLQRSQINKMSGNRLLLEAEAGMGKSTIMQKIAMDWSTWDRNVKEETPSSPVPFDLVILIEGSNIHSGDIKEVIKNNILPFAKSKETMRLLEDPKIQERTLILLDGFDEIQNPEKKLLPILSGSKLGRCTVILTCRTNHAASLSKQFDETYVIPGFQESSADEFIRKYAEETCTHLETFEALRSNSDTTSAEIKELMKTPLYLLYLCILLEDGHGDLPRSRTEVYQSITNIVVNKTSDRLGIEKEACSEAFAELCKLAFRGILDKKMEFEERDLPKEKMRRDVMLAFGFLAEKMSKSRLAPKKLFSFNHKTVQEFLTANHVTEMEEEERNQFLNMKKLEKDWTMVLAFLFGLHKGDDEELDKLYRKVICRNLSDSPRKATSVCSSDFLHNNYHLGLQCISESGTFRTFVELSPMIIPHSFILSSGMECYYCLQGFQMATKLPLPHKPEIVFNGMDLPSFVLCKDAIANLLTNSEVNQSLVASCLIQVKDLIHMINFTGPPPICKRLEHLYIYMSPVTLSSPDLTQNDVAAVLKNLVGLESLVFVGPRSIFDGNDEEIKQEMQHILQRIPLDAPQLKTLVLSTQVLDTPLTVALSKLSNLRKLHLCTIRTKDRDLAAILRHVGQRKKLTSLVLDCCAQFTSEESRIVLANSIGNTMAENCLRKLTLANIDLRSDNMISFLESFSSMQHLEQLTLGGTVFSDANKIKIISALENLRTLKVVSMISFGVSDNITAFTNAVRNLETLQVIEIVSDAIGEKEGFVELSRTLKNKQHLQRVILEGCKITDSNIHALKELFQIPALTELSLTGNSLGETEDAVRQVISGLAFCSKIREVHLFLESVSDEIINTVVKSSSNNNKELEILKVSFKPGMQVINIGIDRLCRMLNEGIPSLKDLSCGISMVEFSMKPHKTDHEIWRSECLDL